MPSGAPPVARPASSTASSPPYRRPAIRPTTGLWMLVRRLPAKQRAAVAHRFVLDLAYAEIGARMGTSEEAARQNVSAGLRRLRREVIR